LLPRPPRAAAVRRATIATMLETPAPNDAPEPAPPAAEPAAALVEPDAPAAAEDPSAAQAGAPEAEPAAPATPELSPAQTGAKLKELFPALFTALPVLPLKLRIQADIHARAPGVFTKKGLSIFLHRYTTGTPYVQALAQAPSRYDLDGAPAGEIAEEHRSAAVQELARRKAAIAERRAAERAAMPPKPRPARPAAPAAGEGPLPPAQPRPPRPARPGRGPQAERHADRPPRDATRPAARPPRVASHPPQLQPRREPHPVPPPREPEDPARRERALLLRAFESSPLSRANFCALKRIGEAELEAALTLARAERAERGGPAAAARR
jgi:sRNA-binding protein